jgi:hypothetical protein
MAILCHWPLEYEVSRSGERKVSARLTFSFSVFDTLGVLGGGDSIIRTLLAAARSSKPKDVF